MMTAVTVEEHAKAIHSLMMGWIEMQARNYIDLVDLSIRHDYVRVTLQDPGEEPRQFVISVQVDPVERNQENV